MQIPDNPTIKMIFTGLLVIAFDPQNSECQVGVNNQVDTHKFRIEAFKVTADSREKIYLPDFAGVTDIKFTVKNPAIEGITFHKDELFTRHDEDDSNDIRWLADIEGPDFHDGPLAIKPDTLSPVLHLDNGLFYTIRSGEVRRVRPRSDELGLDLIDDKNYTVADFIGANVYMNDDSEAVLSWGEGSNDKLVLKREPGTAYKIRVLNDCQDETPVRRTVDNDIITDFEFYYKVFDEPIEDKRFLLIVTDPGTSGDNPRFPCGPVNAGRTTKIR